jgi:hypothetical protein
MASLIDADSRHSLWLQLRSTRRKPQRPQWRSDWAPVWILLLLMTILALNSAFMPSNDAVERATQTIDRQPAVVGALAEP